MDKLWGGFEDAWTWWDSTAFSLGPNYKKTLKSLGILGDGIGVVLDFALGIDEDGNISWGNLIIDILSLVSVLGVGSRALKFLTKVFPWLSNLKFVSRFFKGSKKFNKWVTNIIGVLDNSITFFSKKGNAILGFASSIVKYSMNGGKVTTRLIKAIKNNKYVKKIINNKEVKKFWNSGFVKGIRENKYVKLATTALLDFVDNTIRSTLNFATSVISGVGKARKTILSTKSPDNNHKPKKIDYSGYAKKIIKNNPKVFRNSKTKYDMTLKDYGLILNDVSYYINPKYSNWKNSKSKSGSYPKVSSSAKYKFTPKRSGKSSVSAKRNVSKSQNRFTNVVNGFKRSVNNGFNTVKKGLYNYGNKIKNGIVRLFKW